MPVPPIYRPFVQSRQEMIARTSDPNLKKHFQAEIDLVSTWDKGDIADPPPSPGNGPRSDACECSTSQQPDTSHPGAGGKHPHGHHPHPPRGPHSAPNGHPNAGGNHTGHVHTNTPNTNPLITGSGGQQPNTGKTSYRPKNRNIPVNNNFNLVPHGFARDWHAVRFSNTTNEPITVQVTMAQGQALPAGTDGKGMVTIPPGGYVDLSFQPGSSFNFKSTKGDGSVWNQGELFFDEANRVIWGNMSYIYGANSNMRIFSADGQHSGFLGDVVANAPSNAKVGDWGITAPYDRFKKSDDPNDPDSAAGGPNGPKNAGAQYLYSILGKGEGYVGRGRPVEVTDYDDASSLRFTGNMAVVF
ncbi:hypothetical protein [Noviherbaspirillum aridicola]|uniref:Uncharacterized protein n=1 Tax=Noviherbaspirillum aridicola TaxID=2849687 RepID=A0ABQ4Q0B5_9BURK|nr:hypothetical protein [Noviherbaspirillum aridicola]GIZ50579.1 hypothetical protein NCCP691_05930 [Noviherbaspirillum aridicola]